ncbi:hypothetical protein EIN_316560 [Entamoeba invadens IP1]|uniref:Uncharacterized protein n=1 Tax=Entamoeba invadens IP1 TaxID=370355 RepID=A0A0A1TZE7_ENTIV|nr:hypothetical protein EIN_316560 [Entamoeba invadens IP1]ELP86957.1 hypothetical protein EIN_316560 [Entamoeba invadens IP1]|eukprot:XP_004253728.1 hypothetical protein EIN_316560 [Entamoeba invadens IP1]
MAVKEDDLTLKVCVMGDEKTGKTSFVRRMLDDTFSEEPQPYDNPAVTKEITYEGNKIMLTVMDQQGDDSGMTATFFNNANMVAAVCSYKSKDSLNNCKNWLSYGDRYIGGDYLKSLIVTFSDEETKEFTKEEAQTVATNVNAQLFEISSKTGDNTKETYNEIMKLLNAKFIAVTAANQKGGKKGKEKKDAKDKKDGKSGKCLLL